MNFKIICYFSRLFALLCAAAVFGRSAAVTMAATSSHAGSQYSAQGSVASSGASGQGIVSYASISQVNGLLSQLEASSKATQGDLMKLRIEKWKTDGSSKKQALGNVDSIQRNLGSALPEIVGQVRNAPEDLSATFKLYRNLDALYAVMGNVVESVGAFGPKDDFVCHPRFKILFLTSDQGEPAEGFLWKAFRR